MRTLSRTLITVVIAIVIGGVAVGACLAALIPGTVEVATAHHYTAEQVKELKALAEPSTIYWADGTADGSVARPRGPPERSRRSTRCRRSVQDAVIATEDRSFWTNDGIDLGGVFRAFLTNVTSGQDRTGWLHHHAAAGEEPDPHLQARREPQDQGDRGRAAAQREVLQGEDPHRVPEHRVLRFGFLRHQGRGVALLLHLRTRVSRIRAGSTSTSSPSARPRCSPGSSPTPRATARSPTPTAPSAGGPTCSGRWSRRATSPRRRPTPPTTSRRPTVPPPAEPDRRHRLPHHRGAAAASSPNPLPRHHREGAARQDPQGRAEDLHDLRPGPAGPGRVTPRPTPSRRCGARLGRRRWCRSIPRTGAVKAMVSGQDYAVEPDQHRHLAQYGRQTGFDVQGDHPRGRARERLLARTTASTAASRARCRAGSPRCRPSSGRTTRPTAPRTASTPSTTRPRTRSTARSCASPPASGYDKVIATAHAMGIAKDNLDEPFLSLTLGTYEQNTADHGDGDGDHRQQRRAPHAVRGAEGRRRRRQGRLRRDHRPG